MAFSQTALFEFFKTVVLVDLAPMRKMYTQYLNSCNKHLTDQKMITTLVGQNNDVTSLTLDDVIMLSKDPIIVCNELFGIHAKYVMLSEYIKNPNFLPHNYPTLTKFIEYLCTMDHTFHIGDCLIYALHERRITQSINTFIRDIQKRENIANRICHKCMGMFNDSIQSKYLQQANPVILEMSLAESKDPKYIQMVINAHPSIVRNSGLVTLTLVLSECDQKGVESVIRVKPEKMDDSIAYLVCQRQCSVLNKILTCNEKVPLGKVYKSFVQRLIVFNTEALETIHLLIISGLPITSLPDEPNVHFYMDFVYLSTKGLNESRVKQLVSSRSDYNKLFSPVLLHLVNEFVAKNNIKVKVN